MTHHVLWSQVPRFCSAFDMICTDCVQRNLGNFMFSGILGRVSACELCPIFLCSRFLEWNRVWNFPRMQALGSAKRSSMLA